MTSGGVLLSDRMVGADAPCFLVAEAGVNHNGDADIAHRLVEAASEAGADAVKFQTFEPEALSGATAATAPYQQRHTHRETQLEMLRELMLPRTEWAALADHAHTCGLVFLSTPFDLESAQLLLDLGVPAFKIGSGELNNLPLIRELAELERPLLISTGMSSLSEVRHAVESAAHAPGTILLHCVTSYPAPLDEANLLAIRTLRESFDVPVGWSDHTRGTTAAIMAIALGSSVIEKHLTLDRSLPGPDHAASEEPQGFATLVTAVRQAEQALGDGVKRPTRSEEPNRISARRSWHAARDLEAGCRLQPSDVIALRPATGLPPTIAVQTLRARHRIPAGKVITDDDVDVINS